MTAALTLLALLSFQSASPAIVIDDPGDEVLRPAVQRDVDQGIRRVEAFFGKPFPRSYKVEVLPSRAAFDKVFKDRWGVDHTELWAVAAGVSDGLYILSPRVWKTQAADHDPDDEGTFEESSRTS